MAQIPHLTKEDSNLWIDYCIQNQLNPEDFLYDVRVGDGVDPGPNYDTYIREMAIKLSQKRIDAILVKPDKHEVYEITQIAGLKAIGQLVAYPILYAALVGTNVQVEPHLVCRSILHDCFPVISRIQIVVHTVPPRKTPETAQGETIPEEGSPDHSQNSGSAG